MGKLFGTDGIRGIVGENLTVELAFHVGQAVAAVLTEEKGSKPTITIGKDTRISSDMLEAALMAGICSVGGDVMPLGTIPTPAVAYLTVLEQADAGIVISASHNPYEHNGIKVFNARGYKLSDESGGPCGGADPQRRFHGRQDPRRDRQAPSRDAADEAGLHRPSDFQHRLRPVGPAGAGGLRQRRSLCHGAGSVRRPAPARRLHPPQSRTA